MSSDRARADRVRDVFDAVGDLAAPERAAYLSNVAMEHPEVAAEVELLLSLDPGEDAIREVVGAVAAAFGEPHETEGSTIGPYRLVRELGRGGMGTVWLAERDDDAYRAHVAIKLLSGRADAQHRARFRAERQILATLEHPNVAHLIDGGTTPSGAPYVVMEYVRGEPIDVHCERNRLDVEARLELFCQVCSAVQYAHRHLIVHRDLKPTNILVDSQGVPKLLDFGIAKLLDASALPQPVPETRTGSHLLTPRYASPEQIRGEPITTAVDVYSLGVLLHTLLTGTIPYRLTSPDPIELARAVCELEPVPPSVAVTSEAGGVRGAGAVERERLGRRLEGDLDNIVSKALRKEPKHRYGSPEELADDIRRHLARRPVVARPATRRYRFERFVSRHRWRLVGATATALLLVIATLFSFAQMRAAVQAREIAERERTVAVSQALRATLSAASTRIDAREPLAARGFLESVEEGERGWEWRYLKSELERPLVLVAAAEALSAALPAGGRTVVTVTPAGLVEWRDLLEGTVVRATRLPVDGPIRQAAFSTDGARLGVATGSPEPRVSLWELDGQPQPQRVLDRSATSGITDLALTGPGLDLIATSADSTWIWRAGARDPVRIPFGSPGASLAVAADDGLAAVVGPEADGSYRILDADDPERGMSTLGRDVSGIALSPDGRWTASGESDRTVRLRATASGRVVGRLNGHAGRPEVLTFASDGRLLASAAPNEVRLWDVERQRLIEVHAGPEDPRELRFASDGGLLAVVSEGGEVRVWANDASAESSTPRGAAATYSADGSIAWTVSFDGELHALDHASGELVDVVDLGAVDVTRLVSSSDDRWIATLHGGVPMVRAAVTPERSVTLDTGPTPVVAFAFAPADPRFATLDVDGHATVWDVSTWTPVVRMTGSPAPLGTVTFSPDASLLVTTHDDGARIWSASTAELVRLIVEPGRTPRSAAYGPDGEQLAIGFSDGSIELLDVAGPGSGRVFGLHRASVSALAYTPDGVRLASGAEDGSLWVSDPRRATALLELRGHAFGIESLSFSKDGTKLLSGDLGGLLGGNLRVWDSAPSRERRRAATRLELARDEVERVVSEMLSRSPDAVEVASALRKAESLDPLHRRAALQIALEPPLPESGITRDPFDGFAFESTSLDSHVRIEPHESLRMRDAFTVEAWVQPLPTDGEEPDPGIVLNKEGEYQIARFANGEMAWVVAGPEGWLLPWRRMRYRLPLDAWTHVALVRDGPLVHFHVNGRRVQTLRIPERTGDHHSNMDELRLLGRQHTPASLRGRIDEVRIWSIARSELEIRRAMIIRMSGDEPGLVAAWSLDEGAGEVAGDATGRHPGTLVGGGWSETRRE